MAVRHALEHVFEVGAGLDPVELCRGETRGDDGPSVRAAVRPGGRLANPMDCATASAGTGAGADVRFQVPAREMIGRVGTAVRCTSGILFLSGHQRRQFGLRSGDIGVEIFEPEGKLIRRRGVR